VTEEELTAIEGRANAATLGPWEVGDPYNQRTPELVAVYGMGMEVAALVAEVRRLRELVLSSEWDAKVWLSLVDE
jgi:hypothetical protein